MDFRQYKTETMKNLILLATLFLTSTAHASPIKLEIDGGSEIKRLFSSGENLDFNDVVKAEVANRVSAQTVKIIQEGLLETPTPDVRVEYGADINDNTYWNVFPTGSIEGTVTFLDKSRAPHELKIGCFFQVNRPGIPSQRKLCAVRFGWKIAQYLNSQLDQ